MVSGWDSGTFFFFLAAVALGSIPGQGTKIPQAAQFRKKKKNQNQKPNRDGLDLGGKQGVEELPASAVLMGLVSYRWVPGRKPLVSQEQTLHWGWSAERGWGAGRRRAILSGLGVTWGSVAPSLDFESPLGLLVSKSQPK